MTQFIIARHALNVAILMELANAEAAAKALETIDEVAVAMSKEAFPGDLTGPELVAIHNALVPKEKATKRFATRAAAVKRVLAAWDAYKASQPEVAAPKAERAKSPKKERAPKADGGIIHMIPFKHSKRWQKGSARSQAYEWLAANVDPTEGSPVEGCLTKLEKSLSLSRPQVRGLINKLVGVKALRVVAPKEA
jgi:hypothetical protein